MTEVDSEGAQEIPKSNTFSRRKFIVGAAVVGVSAVIAGRKQIAESVFSVDDDALIDSNLGKRFPREKIMLADGTIAFRDLKPEKLREAQDVPLISMVGLGMDQAVIGFMLQSLYDQGEHVIPLDFIGGSGSFGTIDGEQEINRRGDMIGEFITKYLQENPNVKQFDLMGQSLSAISMLAFARRHPEMLDKVRNVLPVSPMGIQNVDSVLGIKERKSKEDARNKKVEKSEEDEKVDAVIKKTFARNVLSSPIRSLEELLAMAKAGNYPSVEELKRRGVRVSFIQGADDLLADANMLMERIGEGFSETVTEIPEFERNPNSPQVYEYIPLNSQQKEKLKATPSVRFRKGGHEIMSQSKFAGTVLRAIDRLNNPITEGQAVEFAQAGHRKAS